MFTIHHHTKSTRCILKQPYTLLMLPYLFMQTQSTLNIQTLINQLIVIQCTIARFHTFFDDAGAFRLHHPYYMIYPVVPLERRKLSIRIPKLSTNAREFHKEHFEPYLSKIEQYKSLLRSLRSCRGGWRLSSIQTRVCTKLRNPNRQFSSFEGDHRIQLIT